MKSTLNLIPAQSEGSLIKVNSLPYQVASPLTFSRRDIADLKAMVVPSSSRKQKSKLNRSVINLDEENDKTQVEEEQSFQGQVFTHKVSKIFLNKKSVESVYKSKRWINSVVGYKWQEEKIKIENYRGVKNNMVTEPRTQSWKFKEIPHVQTNQVQNQMSIKQIKVEKYPQSQTQSMKHVEREILQNKCTQSIDIKQVIRANQIKRNRSKPKKSRQSCTNLFTLLGFKQKSFSHSYKKISAHIVLLKIHLEKCRWVNSIGLSDQIEFIEIKTQATHKKDPIEVKNTGEQVKDKSTQMYTIQRGQAFNLKSKVNFGVTVSILIHFEEEFNEFD